MVRFTKTLIVQTDKSFLINLNGQLSNLKRLLALFLRYSEIKLQLFDLCVLEKV
jgi:hypothetical protein